MVTKSFKQAGEIHEVPQVLTEEKPSIVSFFESMKHCHAHEHGKDKYQSLVVSSGHADQTWTWTKASQTPANAEHQISQYQGPINMR
jgi:hypothetical protein